MAQTKEGGRKQSQTIRQKYGQDFWAKAGAIGGKKKVPKGFAMFTPEKRSEAGRKGGSRSRRGSRVY